MKLDSVKAETERLRSCLISIYSPGARSLADSYGYRREAVVTVQFDELLRNIRKTLCDQYELFKPNPRYRWVNSPFPYTIGDIDDAITILRHTLKVTVKLTDKSSGSVNDSDLVVLSNWRSRLFAGIRRVLRGIRHKVLPSSIRDSEQPSSSLQKSIVK